MGKNVSSFKSMFNVTYPSWPTSLFWQSLDWHASDLFTPVSWFYRNADPTNNCHNQLISQPILFSNATICNCRHGGILCQLKNQ